MQEAHRIKLGYAARARASRHQHDNGDLREDALVVVVLYPTWGAKPHQLDCGFSARVYGTVRQSGGCITVSSKLGEGTTVQIRLPRVEEPVDVLEMPAALPPSCDGVETVLVLEDDDAVRRMTREILTIKGYNVLDVRSERPLTGNLFFLSNRPN